MATKQFNRTVEAINVLLDKLDGLPVAPMTKKGTILNPSYLPEDATEGDVYLVLYSDSGNAQTSNSLYYKTASNWEIIATKGYTPYEIDQMFESIGGGLRWKGAVSYYSNLPSNAELGDMWTVLYEGSSGTEQSGDEYAWGTLNGTEQWILIGKETYSKAQIDDKVDGLTDRIETNENNISWNTKQGVKNVATLKMSVNTGNANVTFTQNADKSYTLTISATTSAAVAFDISDTFTLAHSEYVLSGNPSSGAVRLVLAEGTAPYSWIDQQYGDSPKTITPVADKVYKLSVFIYANTAASTLTIKPMMCPKSLYDADPTYQPYAPSNRELYEMILALQ